MASPDSNPTYEGSPPEDIVESWRAVFARQRAFAEHALDQLDDPGFFWTPAPGINSVAVIARHLAGNMQSRWGGHAGGFAKMLSGEADGEAPERDRDAELAPLDVAADQQPAVRAQIMRSWERGWRTLDEALRLLGPQDLAKRVTIRGVPHLVHAAAARQLDHYAFHVGQINVLARIRVGAGRWRWFTLAPGQTKAFNERMRGVARGPGGL